MLGSIAILTNCSSITVTGLDESNFIENPNPPDRTILFQEVMDAFSTCTNCHGDTGATPAGTPGLFLKVNPDGDPNNPERFHAYLLEYLGPNGGLIDLSTPKNSELISRPSCLNHVCIDAFFESNGDALSPAKVIETWIDQGAAYHIETQDCGYNEVIYPLLTSELPCTNCHISGGIGEPAFILKEDPENILATYQTLIGKEGLLNTNDPDESLILKVPITGTRLDENSNEVSHFLIDDASTLDPIRCWIENGALNN